MNYHENAHLFYGVNKLIVNLSLIVSHDTFICVFRLSGYCRNSCSGDYEYDGRELRDGKCGYSEKTCCLSATYTGSSGADSADGGTDVPIGAVVSSYASEFIGSSCNSTESNSFSKCTATSNQSWVSNIKITDPVLANAAVLTANVSANTSTSSRSATITVRNACGETATFTYTQNGKPSYTFEWYPEGTSSKTISLNNNAANNSRLSVSSYKNGSAIGFSCSSSASWLTCDGTTTSDMGWRVSENTSTSSRSATITLTQNESGNKITLTVSQEGVGTNCISGTVTLHYNPTHGNYSGYSMNLRSERNLDRQLNGAFVYRLNNTGAIYTIYYTTLFPNRSSWTETRFGGTSETVPHNGEKVYFVLYEGGVGNTPYPDSTVEEDCGGIVVQMDND